MVKKNIKAVLFLVIGLVFSLSALTYAQPRGMDVESRVKMMKERLILNELQETAITKILKESQEKMAASREKFAGDFDEMRKAMMENMQFTDARIDSLLNDKQKEEYKKMQEERRQRMMNRGNN